MDKQFVWAVIKRGVKVFVAGGIGQAVVVALTSQSIDSWNSMEKWLIMLSAAFIAGGLAALDKAVRFDSNYSKEDSK